ncbi:hypothetical protein NKJ26_11710 [Mesorhizobium sp. M0152]|uniref:hypothetical protein n=1 Tax=Mesorhizobium sp. M0152 TaxID=2956898 RepID=UPI0033398BB3
MAGQDAPAEFKFPDQLTGRSSQPGIARHSTPVPDPGSPHSGTGPGGDVFVVARRCAPDRGPGSDFRR